MDEAMMTAVREAWTTLAPPEKWRGHATGWTATDLWTLGTLIHETQPAAVIMADGLGLGGLPMFVGDLLDLNKRGKVLAAEPMSRERRLVMPGHRRVQYVNTDLATDPGRAEEFITAAAPVLLLAGTAAAETSSLPRLVTLGGYMVAQREPIIQQGFVVDQGRDPFGLSQRVWLMRVPV